jgi:hypothetical protein
MNKSIFLIATLALASTSFAKEAAAPTQDRESMAMDSTASQWSFQLAHQWMPNYHDDILDDGTQRQPGLDNYAQFRIVAPIPLKTMTILPRLTIRHYEAPNGDSGFGNTELFGLIIPKPWDWGTGRVGIGPLITAPGDSSVARDEWGYGFAAAAVNTQGKWFYGLLFTQTWRSIDPTLQQQDPTIASDTNPLGIAPFLAYRIGKGYYVQTADLIIQYDWNNNEVYMPIGARVGKVFVTDNGSWNLYGEYVTSLIYDDWSGSAVKDSFRINVSYTIPVSL